MKNQNQKGISSILIILIIVGVLAVSGGIWYASIRTESSKPPKLEKLAGLNPTFKTFLDESAKKYPDLSIDKFTTTESKGINIIGEGFSKIDGSDDPVWTYSPDKTKAVSSLGYYGEPDSSLELYNRKSDKKIELLRTCGTPCSYQGEFWLDNKQFVFTQTHEYYPPNGEVRCAVDTKCTEVVSISLYNLEKNTETIYQSPEIDKPIMLPSWPGRDLQIKAACEGLYGKDDPYCQSKDETADWQTYTNTQYGFSIKYPLNLNYKLADTTYGWPYAIVLFGGPGGQSYYLAIEVWNNESEFNAARGYNVQPQSVFKKIGNQYISLWNGNKDPVVDQMISTFKLVEK